MVVITTASGATNNDAVYNMDNLGLSVIALP